MSELFVPPLADRAMLVLTKIEMVAESKDGFFSDDDVLDSVELFTTEPWWTTDDMEAAEWGDYRCLSDAIWLALETATET